MVAWRLGPRAVGSALSGTVAGIHLDLWEEGYRRVHLIGPSFILAAVAGAALAAGLLVVPARRLPLVSALGAGYCAATLAALWLSVNVGLFGFREYTGAPLITQSIAVEVAGIAVMGGVAVAGALPVLRRAHR